MHALITAPAIRVNLGYKSAMSIEDFLPARIRVNTKFTARLLNLTLASRFSGKQLP